jgi:NitT/TauT family transport system ATP-binding protein
MLHLVGLEGHEPSLRAQLSQGQRQRVALARALVTRPRMLVLDEPFAALDAQTRMAIQGELHRAIATRQPAVTVLLVTHDIGEAVALSDQVIELSARPARRRDIYDVGLGWPRDLASARRDPSYLSLCDRIWTSTAVEASRGSS